MRGQKRALCRAHLSVLKGSSRFSLTGSVLVAASAPIKLHHVKRVGRFYNTVRAPAFFTANTVVGQWHHPRLITGNSRHKRADFWLFGRLKGTFRLIESVFHAATLATFFELHATSDLM